jgi:hypothetical protein
MMVTVIQCEFFSFSAFLMTQFVGRNGSLQWGGMAGHHQFMLVCVLFILRRSASTEQDRRFDCGMAVFLQCSFLL